MSAQRVSVDSELPIELVFKLKGGVELRQPYDDDDALDKVLWASDSDPAFMDRFNTEVFNVDQDSEAILQYLVAKSVLTDDEADEAEIYEESDGPGDDEDEDEDSDDEDEED